MQFLDNNGLIGLLVVALLVSCEGEIQQKPQSSGNPDAAANPDSSIDSNPDVASPDLGQDMNAPNLDMPVRAEFGLDERPSNTTCQAFERPQIATTVELEDVYESIFVNQPLWMEQPPGDNDQWYAIEKPGRVMRFNVDPAVRETSEVLDLRGSISDGGERGLLGLAFHPEWPTRPDIFLNYTTTGALRTRVSRFTSTDGGLTLDESSEKILLEIDQPFGNHNGGQISFGPDGYLYVGMGDGGSGGDPQKHGQNIDTLLGAMLRIDVDGGDPYGIPADNPFAGGGGAREIFAWGLRNPWRFSFDRNTGALWAGDVGQNQWEEVSIVELGGNYGWSDKEGSHCYDTTPCTTGPWIDPVTEYDHSQGNSITGGYVYRGQNIPTLFGSYVYGDYSSGRIWSFRIDPMTGLPVVELLVNSNLSIVSFAEDHQGELYVLSIDGRMRKLVDGSTASPTETIPRQLSQTGCVDPEDPTKPSPGLIPYKPIAEFWSDGAEKTRYIALPDGEKVDIEDDGDFGFPIGTVLVKHFTLSGRRIETRLFMRHADGEWGGYTYRWSENEDEATLLDGSAQAQVGEATWNFPSRGECMSCHTLEAGRSLGLEIAQLNSDLDYESTGRRANQLATLDHIGIFSGELAAAPANLDKLTDPQRGSVLDERARSYLHTNCAGCHRSDRAGRVSMDLRFATELGELSACETDPATGDLGVAGAKLLRPGAPEESLIWLRMNRMDAHRMPPLGGNTIDAEGLGLIEAWILDIAECP